MVTTYVRFALDHQAHYRTMFEPSLTTPSATQEGLQDAARHAFERLVHGIASVRPQLSEPRVRRLAVVAWSLAHGAVILESDRLISSLAPDLDPDTLAYTIGQSVVAWVFNAAPEEHL